MQCCAVRSCLEPREGCQSDVTKTSLVMKIFLLARFSSHFPPSANSLFCTLLIVSHFLHLCNIAASYTDRFSADGTGVRTLYALFA